MVKIGHIGITRVSILYIYKHVAYMTCTFATSFAGVPGRAHDSGVFGMSPISKNLDDYIRKQGRNLIETYNVLADSAYPISKYMITQYKNFDAMTQVHKKFNQHLGLKCQVYLSF